MPAAPNPSTASTPATRPGLWPTIFTSALGTLTVATALTLAACASQEHHMSAPPDQPHPLASTRVMAFAATSDGVACRAFYEGKLGMHVREDEPMALVLESEGTVIRIQKFPSHKPVQYTVLGWQVSDIRATAARLAAAGVTVERFEWMKQQDETGIATFPNGDMVAWFRDPDGNVLSIAQLNAPGSHR